MNKNVLQQPRPTASDHRPSTCHVPCGLLDRRKQTQQHVVKSVSTHWRQRVTMCLYPVEHDQNTTKLLMLPTNTNSHITRSLSLVQQNEKLNLKLSFFVRMIAWDVS